MQIFTKEYELMTGLTNVLIFILAIVFYFKVKDNNKLNDKSWPSIFILVFASAVLGTLIHGINFPKEVVNILWGILSLVFCILFHTLVTIFLKIKKNRKLKIFLATVLIYTILIIEIILKLDFLTTFILYACLNLIICTIFCIKDIKDYNNYILLAIIFQFIGGLFLLNKNIKIPYIYLNNDGIYHIFVLLTLVSFYKGLITKNKNRTT